MRNISKWSDFQINENFKLILEANLELMPNLIKTLKGMESPIAKFIIDLNDRDLDTDINKLDVNKDEAGHITYFPQKKLDNPSTEEFWIIKDDGECYSSWSNASKYFGIKSDDTCGNDGDIGKIVKSASHSTIDKGDGRRGLFHFLNNDIIVCHFKTNDGKDVIINKEGLEEYNPIEKYKQTGKVGRVITKILNLVQQKFTNKDIEAFSNEFKSKTSKKDFELVNGEDIRYWYHEKRYHQIGGPLNASCMRYNQCQEYLNLYVDNKDVCQLLILRNKDNEEVIDGRALVWKLDNDKTLMDRIYYTSDFIRDMFIEYAEKNGWYYKSEQNSSDYVDLVNKDGDVLTDVSVSVKPKETYSKFPYMDTIKYWNEDRNKITTDSSEIEYAMEDTEGGDGGCHECGGSGRVNCHECDGEKRVECYDCDGNGEIECGDCDGNGEIECGECDGEGEIDGEKCSECSGKGKIECGECSGKGEIECYNCDGNGKVECGECDGEGIVYCSECS